MSLGPSTLKYFRSFRLPMTGNEGVEAFISTVGHGDSHFYEARIVNFSLSGLALVSRSEVKEGTQVKVKLCYKKVDYLFHAQVRRSFNQSDEYLLGVEFDQNDQFLSKRFLEKFILDLKQNTLKGHITKLITEEALPNNLDYIHSLELSSSCLNEIIPKRLSRRFFKYSLKDYCLAHDISYMRLENNNAQLGIKPIEINMSEHEQEGEKEWSYTFFNHEDKSTVTVSYKSVSSIDENKTFELNVLLKIFLRYKEDGLSIRESKFLVPTHARTYVFVGQGSAVAKLRKFINKAKYNCLPIGITGKKGDGKQLLAKIIHSESKRQDGPVVIIDGKDFTRGQEIQGLLSKAFQDCEKGSVIICNYDQMHLDHRQVVKNYVKYQIEEREKRARLIMTLSPKGADIFKKDFEIFLKNDEFLLTTIPAMKERAEDTYELVHFFTKKYCEYWGYPAKTPTKDFVSELQQRVASGAITSAKELKEIVKKAIEIQRASSIIDMNPVITELVSGVEIKIPNEKVKQELLELVKDNTTLAKFIVTERYKYFNHDVMMTAKSLGVSRSYVEEILGISVKVGAA